MWKPTGLLLCLLVLGATAQVENGDLEEEENEQLTDFYNLLDEVDDSTLGEIENIIDDGVEDGDQDIPDGLVIDPPEITEDDLPTVQLNEENDDDDDDEEEEVPNAGHKGRRKGGKKMFWKKAKKWAKRLERGKHGEKRRGWWRDLLMKRNNTETEGRRQKPVDLSQLIHSETGKAGRKWERKFEKFRAKVAAKAMKPEVEDDDEEEEEEEDTVGRRGKHHGKGKHHRRGKHQRKGPNRHHRGPHHKRGHHNRHHAWGQAAPLEKRVSMICWKLDKPHNQRFIQVIQQRYAKGIGNVNRKAYRIEFVEKMQDCCKNNATREQCFISLSHQRYDNFCDNEMPLKPWAPAGPRHRSAAVMLSSSCCEHAGEERYSCFNGSRQALHKGGAVTTMEPELDPFYEDDDEDELPAPTADDLSPPVENRRRPGKGRGRGGRIDGPTAHMKTQCCQAGRKGAGHITGQAPRKQCMGDGRKFALHRKEFKEACGITYGRCCIHTVRRHNNGESEVGKQPRVYDFTDEDDEINDDVTTRPVAKGDDRGMLVPPGPVVMKAPGKHHKGKHGKHQQHEDRKQLFY